MVTVLKDWTWAHPTYSFTTSKTVKSVEIDKSKLMADVNQDNNTFKVESRKYRIESGKYKDEGLKLIVKWLKKLLI